MDYLLAGQWIKETLKSNTIIDNQKDPVLEFAYQGPCLKYFGNKRCIVIAGDVNLKFLKKGKEISGKCYETIK